METENRLRLDVALTSRGLAPSRERAQALIQSGWISVNGRTAEKPSLKVGDEDQIEVLGSDHPYVSRGGLKLEKALKVFGIDPAGLVCVDVGASTGGFTDVLLRGGARLVYAVDVGTGQLAPELANNPRVVSMEHTNARTLSPSQFPECPTLAVMDVSFISVQLILPALFALLGEQGRVISLIKPQFEAGPQNIGKKGIVSNVKVHEEVLRRIVAFAPTLGWSVRSLDYSPIAGTGGNLEFLADFIPGIVPSPAPDFIRRLVGEAHRGVKAER